MKPSFKQLHVVSDLHIGGRDGFQIFDQGPELAALIRHLENISTNNVCLVLNGDIVDFLAEDPAAYLDTTGAVRKLERTFTDPAFKDVWQALAAFVKKSGRTLVLMLGNHDVELALPAVRERLLHELSGAKSAARGRVTFVMDGSGFSCSVGGRSVLCLHGNEVDDWNVIDYAALLDIKRAINRRLNLPEWQPNAGTKLVIDFMNRIKKKYPFVDLLKPETKAVPAILVALEPRLIGELRRFGPVAGRLIKDSIRRRLGFLSAEDDGGSMTSEDEDVTLRELLGAGYEIPTASNSDSVDELLDRVEELVSQGGPGGQGSENGSEMLGVTGVIVDHILRRSPAENLRESLGKWLGSDKTFEIYTKDETFQRLDRAIGAEVDYLIAGHTHLERSIPRDNGRGAYFNSGTWVRLIRLSSDVLDSAEKFADVFKRLQKKNMEAIDNPPGLVERRATVVSIIDNGKKVFGELRHVSVNANGKTSLTPVKGSQQES
jgi:UDP-2,3-diacylglucosamine pyrophosphatase LpxH